MMSVYIVQDKYEDPLEYVSSHPTAAMAFGAAWQYEEFDREDGVYEHDKYTVSQHEYCFHTFSEECGHCTKCVCMLEHPDRDCPLIRQQEGKNDRTTAGIH